MDAVRQKEEIELLKNKWMQDLEIFDSDTDYISGKLSVSPFLTPDFRIRCNDHNRNVAHLQIRVNTLPPIELLFQLTPAYPSRDMPNYQISCLWLTYDEMRMVCRQLNHLWQRFNGTFILDLWASFLQEEAIASLGIENLLDLTGELGLEFSPNKKIKLSCGRQNKGFGKHRVLVTKIDMPLSEYLIKYNKDKKLKQFLSNKHTCSKCSQVNPGSKNIVFKTCKHVFCFECMRFMVSSVRPLVNLFYICPSPNCEKTISKNKVWSFIDDVSSNKAYEMKEVVDGEGKSKNQIVRIVGEEEEIPKKTVECPGCGGFVGVYSADDTLAICFSCANIFCYLCTKTYHGLQPCHILPEDKVKVFLAYTSANEEKKNEYINKYGQRRLSRLVRELTGEFAQGVEEVNVK